MFSGVPLPCPDEMVKVSAEQRIDFMVRNKDGFFRVSNTGEITEMTEDEWLAVFEGDMEL